MSDGWSNEELKASVECYVEMQRKERAGQPIAKKQYYRKLAQRFGRSEKAFEHRMQNISFILSLMGRSWLTGLKVAIAAFEIAVREGVRQKNLPKPNGNPSPKARRIAITQFQRDTAVKAWVLRQAGEICECCEQPAPFNGADGLPYLELHYVRQLVEGGADTVSNAVALCPNCHREIHHGANAQALTAWLYDNVARLLRD